MLPPVASFRRPNIFQDASAYLRALVRRLCVPPEPRIPSTGPASSKLARPSTWTRTEAQTHVRWLAEAAHLPRNSVAPLSTKKRRQLLHNVLLLRQGMPLAYILHSVPFADLELGVRPPTLIPRPETEEWTGRLAAVMASFETFHDGSDSFDTPDRASSLQPKTTKRKRKPLRILDLCTGSGAVGIYLAHMLPRSEVSLVDSASTAIQLATENVQRTLLGSRVRVHQGDMFAPVDQLLRSKSQMAASSTVTMTRETRAAPEKGERLGKFDLVTCNPPYVTPDEYAQLDPSVRDYEDRAALMGVRPDRASCPASWDQDDLRGLAFYRQMAALAPILLAGGAQKREKDSDSECSSEANTHMTSGDEGGRYFPQLVLEIGPTQAYAVIEIFQNASPPHDTRYLKLHTEVWQDMAGLDRVVLVSWVPAEHPRKINMS